LKQRKKILIVGGTGFLGYYLCKEALKRNWIVTSISTKKPRKLRYLKKVEYLICDISKKNKVNNLNRNFNYIVNFGGYVDHKNKKRTYESHYLGCKNLADHFVNKKIESFIQLGSSVEYGSVKSPQKETSNTTVKKLKSMYGKSKLLATNYLLELHKQKNFPVTILRLYLVYGPNQDVNRFIPIIIKGCLKDLDFDSSKGTQRRDFIYISDVIDIIVKCLKSKKTKGHIFNVGTGSSVKIKEVIEYIKKMIQKGRPNYGKIKFRKDEILNLYPSINKAKKIIKWIPKKNFELGLKKTIQYYKSLTD
tara:strand:- start:1870 stop:2787 length:918 start_codon:yes stop_codon:yes gene_type:complete